MAAAGFSPARACRGIPGGGDHTGILRRPQCPAGAGAGFFEWRMAQADARVPLPGHRRQELDYKRCRPDFPGDAIRAVI